MVLRRRHDPKPEKPKDDKPPKEDRPRNDPPSPGQGAPPPTPSTGLPTGKITTAGYTGLDWSAITRWAPQAQGASAEFGVPVSRILAHIVIESGGDPKAIQRNPNGDSFGLMQVVPRWWELQIERLAGHSFANIDECGRAMIDDPLLAIRAGCYVLKANYDQYKTWDAASSAFFTGTPNWQGADTVNGTTGNQYKRALDSLIAEIEGAGTTPAPQPQGDVLDLIFGGKPYTITATYGQLITWSCPGCYDYFTAYGLDTTHHWAYDVSAKAGDGAPLYAPFSGTVVCAGTGNGPGAWNTGCAAFPRYNNYGGKPAGSGAGRLELLHPDGDRSLILGHVLASLVPPGARVRAGDLIGKQGGMNGSHVHIEGRYANGTRIGDPRKLFGGGPIPQQYDTVPYVWDASNRNLFLVTAQGNTWAYQRADPQALKLYTIAKGETFEAVAAVPGEDFQEWWLLTNDARVPVDGTKWKVRIG